MAKEEKLNEEAALNNNLNSATLQMNHDIAKQHKKPKTEAQNKKNNKNK